MTHKKYKLPKQDRVSWYLLTIDHKLSSWTWICFYLHIKYRGDKEEIDWNNSADTLYSYHIHCILITVHSGQKKKTNELYKIVSHMFGM